MCFEKHLREQLKLHPCFQPRDGVKMCYQAAFGAEHLLADTAAAKAYFDREYAAVEADGSPLYEALSPEVGRVNLAAWKREGLPPQWLFALFCACAHPREDGQREFERCLALVGESGIFPREEWQAHLAAYRAGGMGPVHHSDLYRQREKPAYRIVSARGARLLPLLQALARRDQNEVTVVAIDGRAASGKSTLAQLLAGVTGGGLIRMDDFFLPPQLRTPERLAAPGGNVHYERFREEVLPHLAWEAGFTYRRFDCSRMAMGEEISVAPGPLRIVEGSYSHHPQLGRYAHITAFSHVEPEEQLARIAARDGEEYAQVFRTRWIPMEENYFAAFSVRERADLQL